MKAATALIFALFAAQATCASPEQADALLRSHHTQQALDALRSDLVRNPASLVARYNYAVGIYASGMYAAAIEALGPLASSPDSRISLSSQFQLGSADFRLAEQMQPSNPSGAAARFDAAVKHFEFTAQQSGELRSLAQSNVTLSHEKAAAAYLQDARAKVAAGERDVGVDPEAGFRAWEASLDSFDNAQKHSPGDAAIVAERAGVASALGRGLEAAARHLVQQAAFQADTAPERAILQYHQALDYYARSAKYGQEVAAAASQVTATLSRTLLAYVHRERLQAEGALPLEAHTAVEVLGKAQASLEDAVALKADPRSIDREQQALRALWHRAYVQLGDDQVADARQHGSSGDSAEQQKLLGAALESYEQALTFLPSDVATKGKRAALQSQLSGLYAVQGRELMILAREKADSQIDEALASAEKALQSFERSLSYFPENETAKAGAPEAQRLLETLRRKVTKDQRKSVNKSRDNLKDTKDLKDLPKDIALKLLDYRNDKPAARVPSLLTAPENKPLQDW